jgi:hypothetical protein
MRSRRRVTDAGRRAGFAQKTKPGPFVTKVFLTDDFQCYGVAKINIERFVSDPIAPRPNSTGIPSARVTSR